MNTFIITTFDDEASPEKPTQLLKNDKNINDHVAFCCFMRKRIITAAQPQQNYYCQVNKKQLILSHVLSPFSPLLYHIKIIILSLDFNFMF